MTPTRAHRRYLLVILLLVLASNQVDRLALGLLLQDIKVDLGLSDTQLGLLTGIAFALFYSLMGIPLARWADKGNRVVIISLTTAIWSTALALSAFVGNFFQMLLVRIVVAIGEAGCKPSSHSLIADYFNREERPRAVAVFMLGGPLSVVIGYLFAGWINELVGWRLTFVILGAPGILLAAIVLATLKEPRRSGARRSASVVEEESPEIAGQLPNPDLAPSESRPGLYAVALILWRIPTFRHLLACYSVLILFTQGIGKWLPSFYIRTFGMGTGELGTLLAIAGGLGGLVGTYLGGEWASRRSPGDEPSQLRAVAFGCIAYAAINPAIYLVGNAYYSFAILAVATLGISTIIAPTFATILTLVPPRTRATAIAIIYLCANLIGMGLGPLFAGWLSDTLHPRFGNDSLRWALVILSPGYLWCAVHAWIAARTAARDLQRVEVAAIPDERR